MPQSCEETIQSHRDAIDRIDEQLVCLLNERAEHSLAIRDIKNADNMSVYDPRREEEILCRISTINSGPLYNGHLEEIYTSVLKVMKEVPRP
ncbi:MAG: chorismate mutase [Eggerthellaceae bacterium]|nr:chorismate mutase [Eggerthellaceae bacterium]